MTDIDHGDLPDVPEAGQGGGTATVTVDDVTEAMKDVVDPELGINVVDLGLVYGVHLDEDSNLIFLTYFGEKTPPSTNYIEALVHVVEVISILENDLAQGSRLPSRKL